MLLSALFVVYGATIPWHFDLDPVAVKQKLDLVDWRPLNIVDGHVRALPDLVANLLFFMPLGCALSFATGARRPLVSSLAALVVGFALSVAVETFQLVLPDRTPSGRDVFWNTLGCVLAGAVTAWTRARYGALARRALDLGFARNAEAMMALGYLALLAGVAYCPFDFTLDFGSVKADLRHLLRHPFGVPGVVAGITLVASWIPAGLLMARALTATRARSIRVVAVTALAAVFAGVLELGQVIVESHSPSLGETALAALGALMGALACGPLERRATRDGDDPAAVLPPGSIVRAIPITVTAMVVAFVTLQALDPFALESPEALRAKLTPAVFVPFAMYYANLRVDVLSDLLGQLVTFGALGYALAARAASPGAAPPATLRRRAAVYAFALAAALEGAQVFVRGRAVDVSDPMLAAAGAALGVTLYAWLVRRTTGPSEMGFSTAR